MNKIITNLNYYTFDSNEYNEGQQKIEWWVLEKDEDGNENGRTFSFDEEKRFLEFVLSMEQNFPGEKNSFKADDEDAPCIDIEDLVESGENPNVFVLRKSPSKYRGVKYLTMDITLYPKHNYNLNFDVIGELLNNKAGLY